MINDRLVFFDLDGTISRRDTFKEILFFTLLVRPIRLTLIPFSLIDFLLYKLKIISNTEVKKGLLKRVFSSMECNKLEIISNRYTRFFLKHNVHIDALSAIEKHKAKGDFLVLVTASFDFYVESLGRELGFDFIISTRAEISGSKLTGIIDGENCYGEEKINRINQSLNLSDYREKICYTDHHSDIPLLNSCDKKFVVNPSSVFRAKYFGKNMRVLTWN